METSNGCKHPLARAVIILSTLRILLIMVCIKYGCYESPSLFSGLYIGPPFGRSKQLPHDP